MANSNSSSSSSSSATDEAAWVLRDALALVLEHRPHDPVAFLANHLQRSAVGATHIEHAFRVLQLGAASSCVAGPSGLPKSTATTSMGMSGAASTRQEQVGRGGSGGGGGGGSSSNSGEKGAESCFEKCPGSVEDTILASYQCLQRRGTGHSAFAAAAKQETRRRGGASQLSSSQRFRFGRMGGGVCGRDVRLLARRVLLAGAGSLPPLGRSMVKRVLEELHLPADDNVVVDYSTFALCLRTVLHILTVADTVRTALVLFCRERTSAGFELDPQPRQTHSVPTQPNGAKGAQPGPTAPVFVRVWNSGQRFLGVAEAVDFVSKLTGLSIGNIKDVVHPTVAARTLDEIHSVATRAAKEAARRNGVLHTRLQSHRPPAAASLGDSTQHADHQQQPPPTRRQRSGSAGSASESALSNSKKSRRQLHSRSGRGRGAAAAAAAAGGAEGSAAKRAAAARSAHILQGQQQSSTWGTSLMEAAPIPPFFVVDPGSASIAEAAVCNNNNSSSSSGGGGGGGGGVTEGAGGVDTVQTAFSDATFVSADQLMEAVVTLLAKE